MVTTAVTANLSGRMAPAGSTSVYRRTFPMNESADPAEYRVVHGLSGRMEGALIGVGASRLSEYMLPGGPEPEDYAFPWPEIDRGKAAGFFLDFEPPLVVCPGAMSGGSRQRVVSAMRCYGAKGRHIYNGEATRDIRFEGYETVVIDEVPYSDCVRLRVETRYRFPWIARIDVGEYVWFAPGVGEVKRIQRWRGFVLLAYFETAVQDELLRLERSQPAEQERSIESATTCERWRRCAVYLSPSLPKPMLGGLIAEMVVQESGDE